MLLPASNSHSDVDDDRKVLFSGSSKENRFDGVLYEGSKALHIHQIGWNVLRQGRRGDKIDFITIVSRLGCIDHILELGRPQLARFQIVGVDKVGSKTEVDAVPFETHGFFTPPVVDRDVGRGAMNAFFDKRVGDLCHLIRHSTSGVFQ